MIFISSLFEFAWWFYYISTENPTLKTFMCSFDLARLLDSATCYKSINPTCIDLILTNRKNHFMKSTTFETNLSDHHKPATTILRKTISEGNSRKKNSAEITSDLTKRNLKLSWNLTLNSQTNLHYSNLQAVFVEVLNKIALIKIQVLRFNNNAFMTKCLKKAIIIRSRFKNNFNKKKVWWKLE